MNDKFQVNFDIIPLYDENNPPPPVTKVGIVPFMTGKTPADMRVLLMKPAAEVKYLGEPSFQLAKGTRRIFINEHWVDMRQDDLVNAHESFFEPLIATALREGHEEIGLKSSNILKAYDMGGFRFTSVTRAVVKPLHMFAARMKDAHDFDRFEATTGEARWMTLEQFAQDGREDHVTIVREIMGRLMKAI